MLHCFWKYQAKQRHFCCGIRCVPFPGHTGLDPLSPWISCLGAGGKCRQIQGACAFPPWSKQTSTTTKWYKFIPLIVMAMMLSICGVTRSIVVHLLGLCAAIFCYLWWHKGDIYFQWQQVSLIAVMKSGGGGGGGIEFSLSFNILTLSFLCQFRIWRQILSFTKFHPSNIPKISEWDIYVYSFVLFKR